MKPQDNHFAFILVLSHTLSKRYHMTHATFYSAFKNSGKVFKFLWKHNFPPTEYYKNFQPKEKLKEFYGEWP